MRPGRVEETAALTLISWLGSYVYVWNALGRKSSRKLQDIRKKVQALAFQVHTLTGDVPPMCASSLVLS